MSFEPQDPQDTKKVLWWQFWRKLGRSNKRALKLDAKLIEHSTHADWIDALESLQPLVRHMRNDIDALDTQQISFDILGAGTFLLQIDLLLIKIRQHFNNYQRRIKELNTDIPQVGSVLADVEVHCKQSYAAMMVLNQLLKSRTYMDLNDDEVIKAVSELEEAAKNLTERMHHLNEIALKRDPIYQLFENELFKTLMELEQRDIEQPQSMASAAAGSGPLRDTAHSIEDPELRKIAFNIISYYDTLKRCSLLYQSQSLTQSLDAFARHIEQYMGAATQSPLPEKRLVALMQEMFGDIEAMRFIPHKGFRDKLKTVKKQWIQLLRSSDFGQTCLQEVQVSMRSKIGLKSRFR